MRPDLRARQTAGGGRREVELAEGALGAGYGGPPRTRAGIWLRYAWMRAKVRLAYRGDFALLALGDLLVAGLAVLFLWSLFAHVPHTRGYRFSEVLLLWGMGEASAGLFLVGFQGLWALNQQYLLRGEMDRVLLRPLDAFGQVLLDHLNLEDLPLVGLGLAMIGLALPGLPPLGLAKALLLPVFVLSGALVLAGTLTAFSSLGFWLHHRGTAIGLVYQTTAFHRYPLDLFARPLRWLFTVVLPLGFVAAWPAAWLLGRAELVGPPLLQPLLGPLLMAAGHRLWRWSLRRYRSPGS